MNEVAALATQLSAVFNRRLNGQPMDVPEWGCVGVHDLETEVVRLVGAEDYERYPERALIAVLSVGIRRLGNADLKDTDLTAQYVLARLAGLILMPEVKLEGNYYNAVLNALLDESGMHLTKRAKDNFSLAARKKLAHEILRMNPAELDLAGLDAVDMASVVRAYSHLNAREQRVDEPLGQTDAEPFVIGGREAQSAPSSLNLLDFGVHPWINIGSHPEPPAYIIRAHDHAIRSSIEDVSFPRLVVIEGQSSTGKSRAAWEAVQALPRKPELVYPRGANNLLQLLRNPPRGPTIVWLNEMQNYLTTDRVFEVASELARMLTSRREPLLFMATIRSSYLRQLAYGATAPGSDETPRSTLIRELFELSMVRIVHTPSSFNATEDRRAVALAADEDGYLAEVARLAGPEMRLAQAFSGGPSWFDRYLDYQDSDNIRERTAAALMTAAADLRSIGFREHIPVGTLMTSAHGYLRRATDVLDDEWFGDAIDLASASLLGVRALEIVVGIGDVPGPAYRLHDYLAEHVGRQSIRQGVPRSVWEALACTQLAASEVVALATSAHARGLHDFVLALERDALDPHGAPLDFYSREAISEMVAGVYYERKDETNLKRIAIGGFPRVVKLLARLRTPVRIAPIPESGPPMSGLSAEPEEVLTLLQDAWDSGIRRGIDAPIASTLLYRRDVEALKAEARAGNRCAVEALLFLHYRGDDSARIHRVN